MIILEGTDLVGKTTLAKELLKSLPSHSYAHLSRLPEGWDIYWDYVNRMNRRTVQDRFHLSEIAYATARGETPKFGKLHCKFINAKLRLVPAIQVIITAAESLIEERFKKQGDDMYDLDVILNANTVFHDLTDYCDVRVHCDNEFPFPDETSISYILRTYSEYCHTYNNILQGKLNEFSI